MACWQVWVLHPQGRRGLSPCGFPRARSTLDSRPQPQARCSPLWISGPKFLDESVSFSIKFVLRRPEVLDTAGGEDERTSTGVRGAQRGEDGRQQEPQARSLLTQAPPQVDGLTRNRAPGTLGLQTALAGSVLLTWKAGLGPQQTVGPASGAPPRCPPRAAVGFRGTPELRAAVELSVDKSSCVEVVTQGRKALRVWVSVPPAFPLLTPARPHTGRCRSLRSAGVRQPTVTWPRAPGSCLIPRGLSEAQGQVPTRGPLGALILPSFKNNFIYSFVAMLGHICAPACSSCVEWGYLLVSLAAGSGGMLYLGCSGLAALQLVRSSQTQD